VDAVSFPGLWRFSRETFRHLLCRTAAVLQQGVVLRTLQRLVPEIESDDLVEGGAGVRAQAMTADGSLVEDFSFVEGPGELHVVNAPSPAATSSLAIGEEIAERFAQRAEVACRDQATCEPAPNPAESAALR